MNNKNETHEIVAKLKSAIMDGKDELAPELTREALEAGVEAESLREKGVSEAKRLPTRQSIDDFYNILKYMGVDRPAVSYTLNS